MWARENAEAIAGGEDYWGEASGRPALASVLRAFLITAFVWFVIARVVYVSFV